jgi:hypothetical protein
MRVGEVARVAGGAIGGSVLLGVVLLFGPQWVWLIVAVVGTLGCLLAAMLVWGKEAPRTARLATAVAFVVVACCGFQPVVSVRGVPVDVASVRGQRIDAGGLHVMWLGGVLPVVFRLVDWAGYRFLAMDASPGNTLSVPSVTGAVLFHPGRDIDNGCGSCGLATGGSHRPGDYALFSGRGGYFVMVLGTGAAWHLRATSGFAIGWIFWGLGGVLLVCLAVRAQRQRLTRAADERT